MKKLTTFLLTIILALSAVLLFSCDDGGDTTMPSSSETVTSTTDTSKPEGTTDTSKPEDNTDPSDQEPPHKHVYAEEWTATEDGHYKACLCHEEEIQVLDHKDDVVDGKCDECQYVMVDELEFTFTATDDALKPLPNAVFTFKLNGTEVGKAITDSTGKASITLLELEYTVEISHLSVYYKLNGDSVITMNAETTSRIAEFTESKDREMIWISAFYDDGTPIPSGQAQIYYFLNEDTKDCGLLGINVNSQAATNSYNHDCYFFAIDKDLNCGYASYKKGDPTNIDIVVKRGERAGSSVDNPLLANTLVKLPFRIEDMLFKYEYAFEAGEYLYLAIEYASGKTFTIDGNLFTLEYNGQEIKPNEDGTIEYTFTDVEYGERAILKVTAKEAAIENIDITNEGSYDNPYYLYSNKGYTQTLTVDFYGEGQVKCFSVANMKENELSVSVSVDGIEVEIYYPEGEVADGYGYVSVYIIAACEGTAEITFTFEDVLPEEAINT